MPIDEIAGGLLRTIFRFVWEILVEGVLEFAFKWPGYLIVRTYRGRGNFDPDGVEVFIWGLLFWVVVIASGVYYYS